MLIKTIPAMVLKKVIVQPYSVSSPTHTPHLVFSGSSPRREWLLLTGEGRVTSGQTLLLLLLLFAVVLRHAITTQPGLPQSCYVIQPALKPKVLLLQPPEKLDAGVHHHTCLQTALKIRWSKKTPDEVIPLLGSSQWYWRERVLAQTIKTAISSAINLVDVFYAIWQENRK